MTTADFLVEILFAFWAGSAFTSAMYCFVRAHEDKKKRLAIEKEDEENRMRIERERAAKETEKKEPVRFTRVRGISFAGKEFYN